MLRVIIHAGFSNTPRGMLGPCWHLPAHSVSHPHRRHFTKGTDVHQHGVLSPPLPFLGPDTESLLKWHKPRFRLRLGKCWIPRNRHWFCFGGPCCVTSGEGSVPAQPCPRKMLRAHPFVPITSASQCCTEMERVFSLPTFPL